MENQTLIVAVVVILFLYFFVFKKKESFDANISGSPYTASGDEGTIFAPKCLPATTLFTYGAPGKQIIVQKRITAPELINNGTMGSDPAPGLGKAWTALYVCDLPPPTPPPFIPNQQPVGWTVTCNKNGPIPGGVYKYLGGNTISHLPTDEIARSVDPNYSMAAGRAIDCTGYQLGAPQTLPTTPPPIQYTTLPPFIYQTTQYTASGDEGTMFSPKCLPATTEFTYGAPGKQIKVQKRITTPELIVNGTMGGDPAPGLPKAWTALYTCT